ncbi:hypothetical protein F4819DRAFT_441369 [Hypoxylon fuscum]|nr:hypothetical protein F4819DRAFT_441369 [Hypoxylon fuscum]
MSSIPDLSLPPAAPELGEYSDCNLDDAAFALYSLADMPESCVQEIASTLEKEWIKNELGTHLALPAKPTANFNNKTLEDVARAHIAMDKKFKPRDDGGAKGDLSWWPTAFLVIVKQDWKTPGGLLFVFVEDEKGGCPMDKFFFNLGDAYAMLSSLSFGDEDIADLKEKYSIESR